MLPTSSSRLADLKKGAALETRLRPSQPKLAETRRNSEARVLFQPVLQRWRTQPRLATSGLRALARFPNTGPQAPREWGTAQKKTWGPAKKPAP